MDVSTYVIGTVQTKAYRILRERVYTILEQYELTPTYWSMLGIIMQAPEGVRQADIARQLHVKPPLITSMARRLQQRGIITSARNQFDARAKLLVVTPAGKKSIKKIDAALAVSLSQLLNGLTQEELITYRKVLLTIISNEEGLTSLS